ncbi:MAG: hypothetical protein RLZZ546_3096 [Bacteroidota bacterium]
MMKNFTFLKSAFCFLFILSFICVDAQTLEFRIDAPANIAGRYQLYRSAFGAKDNNEILNTPIKLAEPILACTDLTNDLTGTIGFVNRGGCPVPANGNFIAKVKKAQVKGAVAVIICNNDNPITNPGLPAGVTDDVTIKSFLMQKADCEKIKAALNAGTVNGNIVVKPCIATPPVGAIWGTKPGEGDFDFGGGDFRGWSVDNEEGKGWEWSATGDCTKGAYAGDNFFIASETVCNGAMVFDSDFLDNTGVAGAFGTGTCPSTPTVRCIGSFTSPNIDLTGLGATGLSVEFTQAYRQFRSDFFLLASYDNGITWDSFEVNASAPVNSNAFLAEKVRIGLCNADLSKNQVRLRFLMQSHYYFWAIDDVYLVKDNGSDPQVNDNFYAVSPTFRTPASQANNWPLLSDIRNNGPLNSNPTVLKANIYDNNGSAPLLLQTFSNEYGNVEGCEQIENIVFTNNDGSPLLYTHPSKEGNYLIEYVIEGTDNTNATNDSRVAGFEMTRDVFSNAAAETTGNAYLDMIGDIVNPDFIGNNNFSIGQYYFMPRGSLAIGKQFKFGVEDDDAVTGEFSASISCKVYKIKSDNNQDESITPDERIEVGRGYIIGGGVDETDYFIDNTTENSRLLGFNLTDLDGKELRFEDNTGYLFILNTTYFSGEPYSDSPVHVFPFLAINTNPTTPFIRQFNTEATDFAERSLISPAKTRNFQSILSEGGADEFEQRNLVGNVSIRLYNELVIDASLNTNELDPNAYSLYPNPAVNEVNVDLNLTTPSKKVKVELFNVAGTQVSSKDFNNVRTETLKIATNGLSSGLYTVRITTDLGTSAKKVMISK